MQTQLDRGRRCDGVARRDFVRLGGLAALGLSLPQALAPQRASAESQNASPAVRAKSCILIWLDGGPSHLETFDLKPDAPKEVRGPFAPIKTSVIGEHVCELLPRTASLLHRMAMVRSVTSNLGEHNFGTHYLMTGYKPTPALAYPPFGAVVSQVRASDAVLPRHIAVPDFRIGGDKLSGTGYLPASCAPFSVGGDPAKPDFKVSDLDFYPGVGQDRVDRRKRFLARLDEFSRAVDMGATSPANPQFEQAYRLVASRQAKQAFDLAAEPEKLRAKYGPRTIGQSCLLARRLVERGVPLVTVNYPGWDTHDNLYTRLKEGYTGAQVPVGLVPSLDLALAALVEDLIERGLYDETLIVVMGEFGRTPKLNTAGGRDHWPRVFSVLLAGAKIPGGQVIGASDATGEGPAKREITPADLAATIYTLLGIDPKLELHTADGRPVQVNRDGKVIEELVG
jgi:hypothetical protein